MNSIKAVACSSLVFLSGLAMADDQSSKDAPALEEITVTAEKRVERLQDVPVPVTVVSAVALIESNQTTIQDYYTKLPNVSFAPDIFGTQLVTIRGITTGSPANTTATVGTTIDDVPFGSTGGVIIPNIDPGDLARIEVLRGPQGTLYGASSMGGLLKYVTVDPSTDRVSGSVEAGTSTVYNGADLGYSARGSVNVPLGDVFAVRLSGFTREDPGYIDNPTVLHTDGVNKSTAGGGHFAALWRPSDTMSLKLSALYQYDRGDGLNDVDNKMGELQQDYVRGAGPWYHESQAYSAIFNDKIGDVNLTFLSGYNLFSQHDSFDASSLLAPYSQYGSPSLGIPAYGVTGDPSVISGTTAKYTEELRIAAPIGPRVDGMVGFFYTHELDRPSVQIFNASNATTGAIVAQTLYETFGGTYREYAPFANLTYHVTDRFDIQVGGRDSYIQKTAFAGYSEGSFTPIFYGVPSPFVGTEFQSKSPSAFTYLFTPKYKISTDLMVYARLASGYRPGGSNIPGPGVPAQYQPDKTENYEIGTKGSAFENILSFDASLYRINWKGIQLGLVSALGNSYTANAGVARSQGLELSVDLRPVTGLTISTWVTFSDATLAQGFPPGALLYGNPVYGVAGEQLPYNSRFSSNIAVNEDFPLTSTFRGFVGGNLSYLGDRQGIFTSEPQREDLPAYAKLDVLGGVKHESWNAHIYVNNLLDRRGLISGGLGNFPPNSFYYITPRTVGITVSKTF